MKNIREAIIDEQGKTEDFEELGVTNDEGRARHIGQINLYRNAAKGDFRLVKDQP